MTKGAMGTLGIILIVLGALSLIYQGISYTTREEVVNIGGIEIQAESEEHIPLPPLVGGLAVVGGVVLVVASRRSR
jgi:hypothetical protein